MPHCILLGDSLFDNSAYVAGEAAVTTQLRSLLPPGWEVTRHATDGHTLADVPAQLINLPASASHLALAIGVNDVLNVAQQLYGFAEQRSTLFANLNLLRAALFERYNAVIQQLRAYRLGLVATTLFDACPLPDLEQRDIFITTATLFNDAVLRVAQSAGMPVIDLRQLCTGPWHFSARTPLEISSQGGMAIARTLSEVLQRHPFALGRTVIYPTPLQAYAVGGLAGQAP